MSDEELPETEIANPNREGAVVSKPPSAGLSPGMQVTDRVRLTRPLGTGGMASVWAAEHLTLGIEVAVKFVLSQFDGTMRERLSREAKLAARVDHRNAVRILDHGETDDGVPFLVMELLEGETVAARLQREGPLPLRDVRQIVRQIADVLSVIHATGILHRDVKPDNLMLVPNSEELLVKLVDFGIAKPTEPEAASLTTEGHIVGTPAYLAPEQLLEGLPASAAADVWGLATVAYEALSGRRPFRGRTRAAIGAAMLLRRYRPISALEPSLPSALDEFFDAALAVAPGDRISAATDFATRFEEACSGAPVSSAPRARSGLRISDKLYGRSAEVTKLMRSFEEACSGRTRCVLIEGYSGTGKTSLVREVHTRMSARGATFVAGKFDQFDRGTPYSALVSALRSLVRTATTRGADEEQRLRTQVEEALGPEARAITEVIPELAELLGPTRALAPASSGEAKARFQNAVITLLGAASGEDRPVVLFLDDLQWADHATVDVLTTLATDPNGRHLLIIGSYRDNEVGGQHPLTAAVERIREVEAPLTTITLGALAEDAVLELINDTFGDASGKLRFAMLCHARTRGNAFFLRRTLEVLHEDGVLVQDPEGGWSWDITTIQMRPVAENIVDFVADEIRRMPEAAMQTLRIASCIGDRFEISTLALALGGELGSTLEDLRPALSSELVAPVTEAAWHVVGVNGAERRLLFRFAHDRVRQAARLLIEDGDAARVHWTVGVHLLDTLEQTERDSRLFEIVEHLNRGAQSAGDADERRPDRLELNLTAARRATRAAAFDAADRYYTAALSLLPPNSWRDEQERTVGVHLEGARAAYRAGDHERMDALVETVQERAERVLDRVGALEVRIQALASQQRFGAALRLAVRVLRELDVDLPEEPSEAEVAALVDRTLEAVLAARDDLPSLTTATDPRALVAQRIQNGAMSSAYLAKPGLLPVLNCHLVLSTLEHGVCPETPYGFAVFGLVLNSIGRIEQSYAVGKIALELLERVDDRSVVPKTRHVVATHVAPFVDPLRDSIPIEEGVVRQGLDAGDLEYAAWALHQGVSLGFYTGTSLDALTETFEHNVALLEHHRQLPPLGCTVAYGQAIQNLLGQSADPAALVGPSYDESKHRDELLAANFLGAAYILCVVGTFVRYLFGDHAGAVTTADAGASFAAGATATYHQVWFHQYRALAALAQLASGSQARLEAVEEDRARLQKWAGFSEANHAHRIALVEGEVARVGGDYAAALAQLERAVAHAEEQGFLHEAALAHELAARVATESGDSTAARIHRDAAVAGYRSWGATAKAEQLAS